VCLRVLVLIKKGTGELRNHSVKCGILICVVVLLLENVQKVVSAKKADGIICVNRKIERHILNSL